MIETIQEYKDSRGLTWAALAIEFGATAYQEAQQWKNNGWVVVTDKNGAARLMSPKGVRVGDEELIKEAGDL